MARFRNLPLDEKMGAWALLMVLVFGAAQLVG